MKVKINKTGEIKAVNHGQVLVHFSDGTTKVYKSISELSNDLSDYKEPKEYWHIAELCGGLQRKQDTDNGEDRFNKQIGNYFETEEEAERAIEKLKAWKRLKDKGFRFTGINDNEESQVMIYECGILCKTNVEHRLSRDEDFILLFGGEE